MPRHKPRFLLLPGWANLFVGVLLSAGLLGSAIAQQPLLAPLVAAEGSKPPPPWRAVGLPRDKAPLAQIDVASVGGGRALRLQTDRSYGTLVHELKDVPAADATLRWRWRLDQPIANADLRKKEGDDAALKVCVMFDMPLDRVPFVERSLLRLARATTSELLPAATVCYVFDPQLAESTELPNAYTRRVRSIIVSGRGAALSQWSAHERKVGADFLKLFGDESRTVPAIAAIVVGADADNTGGTSLGYLADLALEP
jgi:hypothetical protein